eukprot:1009534-Pelagomonas_calceolata.AAC.2
MHKGQARAEDTRSSVQHHPKKKLYRCQSSSAQTLQGAFFSTAPNKCSALAQAHAAPVMKKQALWQYLNAHGQELSSFALQDPCVDLSLSCCVERGTMCNHKSTSQPDPA